MESITGFLRTTLRKKPGRTSDAEDTTFQSFEYSEFALPSGGPLGGDGNEWRRSQDYGRAGSSETYRQSLAVAPSRPSVEADDIITGKHSQDFSSPLSQVSQDSQWTQSTSKTSPSSERVVHHSHKPFSLGNGSYDAGATGIVGEIAGNMRTVPRSPTVCYDIFGLSLERAVKLDISLVGDQPTIITPLCETILQPMVPLFFRKCISFLTQFGIEEEGLYRVSGSKLAVRQLQKRFLTEGPTFELDASVDDVHTVASLVKQYLRELPEDLLQVTVKEYLYCTEVPMAGDVSGGGYMAPTRHEMIHSSAGSRNDYERNVLEQIQGDLWNLNPLNFALLHFLIRHLWLVQQSSSSNRMTLANVALIFSPTLRINRLLLMKLIQRGDIPPNYNRAFSNWRRPSIESATVTKPEPTTNRVRSRAMAHERMVSFDFLSMTT